MGAAAGAYNGQLTSRTYILKVNGRTMPPATVTIAGDPAMELTSKAAFDAASQGWFYDGAAKIVWVKFSTLTSNSTTVAF